MQMFAVSLKQQLLISVILHAAVTKYLGRRKLRGKVGFGSGFDDTAIRKGNLRPLVTLVLQPGSRVG